MHAIPRKLLRTLPTLTEVVTVPTGLSDRAEVASPQVEALPDTEVIIERVMQLLDLSLESHVREVVESVVQEQLSEVQARLKQKVNVAVRQAVVRAVAAELKEPRLRKP
jgi:dynactin complex subunit